MKFLSKMLTLCALVGLITACGDDDGSTTTPPDTNPVTHKFAFNEGDYARYQNFDLDDNNEIVTETRFITSRVIVKTGVSIGGVDDAVLAVDSVFVEDSQGGEFERLDSLYLRLDGNFLLIYDFGKIIANRFNNTSVSLTFNNPQWTRLAELRDDAGNQFSSDALPLSLETGADPINSTLNLVGTNEGQGIVMIDGTSYTKFSQKLAGTANLGLGTVNLDFFIGAGGVDTGTSPSALIDFRVNSTVVPVINQKVTGIISQLIEFSAAQ